MSGEDRAPSTQITSPMPREPRSRRSSARKSLSPLARTRKVRAKGYLRIRSHRGPPTTVYGHGRGCRGQCQKLYV